MSPTGLLERTGSVQWSLIVWALCGFVSLLGSLAYAELGTMIPSSGGEYAYFMVAFGAFPAYTFSWVSTIVIKPSQLAIVCLSFAEYVVEVTFITMQNSNSLVAKSSYEPSKFSSAHDL